MAPPRYPRWSLRHTATGQFTVLPDRSMSGSIKISGMVPTMAHIHEAPVGKNGPPIITLSKSPDDSYAVPAGARLSEAQYKSYATGNLYVNVHSAQYPDGEIRGAIARQADAAGQLTGASPCHGGESLPSLSILRFDMKKIAVLLIAITSLLSGCVVYAPRTGMVADIAGMAAARRPIAPITTAMAFRITGPHVRTIQTATDTKVQESPEHRPRRPAKLRVSGILRASHSRRSGKTVPT